MSTHQCSSCQRYTWSCDGGRSSSSGSAARNRSWRHSAYAGTCVREGGGQVAAESTSASRGQKLAAGCEGHLNVPPTATQQ